VDDHSQVVLPPIYFPHTGRYCKLLTLTQFSYSEFLPKDALPMQVTPYLSKHLRDFWRRDEVALLPKHVPVHIKASCWVRKDFLQSNKPYNAENTLTSETDTTCQWSWPQPIAMSIKGALKCHHLAMCLAKTKRRPDTGSSVISVRTCSTRLQSQLLMTHKHVK
jgi:hypothetical protein